MMNAHPHPQSDFKTFDPMEENTSTFKDIAQRSLNGELLGHMAGFMYDDSCPEQGYVGGAKKWSDFVKKTKKYKFLSNDEMLLKNNAEEMAAEVIGYREGDHHLHFFSLAPGSKFADKDYYAVKAFNDQAQALGRSVHYTGLDINLDFAAEPMAIIGRDFTNIYAGNRMHDMYTETISDAIVGTPFEGNSNRTSVVLYTGGTVEKFAKSGGEAGFHPMGLLAHRQNRFVPAPPEVYRMFFNTAKTTEAG